jgi:hypothetical protein
MGWPLVLVSPLALQMVMQMVMQKALELESQQQVPLPHHRKAPE